METVSVFAENPVSIPMASLTASFTSAGIPVNKLRAERKQFFDGFCEEDVDGSIQTLIFLRTGLKKCALSLWLQNGEKFRTQPDMPLDGILLL
jgi:hypothetical protein